MIIPSLRVHSWIALAIAATAPACIPAHHVAAIQTEARAEGLARVSVREVDDNIFKFSVLNLSKEILVVDRDAVRLVTPRGSRERAPGGVAHTYTIQPGGAHDLNVKFDLEGLGEGTEVSISFTDAILVGGKPVPLDPIRYRLD